MKFSFLLSLATGCAHLTYTYMEGKVVRVAGRFLLKQKLGHGSFGVVYQATDSSNSKQVAVKLESVRIKVPQLIHEARVLQTLVGIKGFPELLWHGTEGPYNILVTELLGASLEALMEKYNRFSLPTVVTCGLQILERLQAMHEKNLVHRDLKPDNILIGLADPGLTYLIDFGLARRYRDSQTKQHIPYKENKSLTGTARYASVNSHIGIEQSRRDDCESLIYILVYLFKGLLPWQGIKEQNKRVRYSMIGDAKRNLSPKALCTTLPEEFCEMLEHIKALRFEETPNYQLLTSKLTSLAKKMSLLLNHVDWNYKQPPRVSARAITQKESLPHPAIVRRSRSSKQTNPRMKKRPKTSESPLKKQRTGSVETVRLKEKPCFKNRIALQEPISGASHNDTTTQQKKCLLQ